MTRHWKGEDGSVRLPFRRAVPYVVGVVGQDPMPRRARTVVLEYPSLPL